MWQLHRILLHKIIEKFRNYIVIVNQNMSSHIQGVNGMNNELKGTAVIEKWNILVYYNNKYLFIKPQTCFFCTPDCKSLYDVF
jgi:hypothetical protein